MQTSEQTAVHPLERRKEPRKKALIHAFVSDREGNVDLKCVIVEISRGGCRIASSYIADLPRIVEILPEGFDKPLTGKVIWRHAKVAGVQFLSTEEQEIFECTKPVRRVCKHRPSGFFNKLLSLADLYRRTGLVTRDKTAARTGLPRFSVRALHGVRQPLMALKGLLGLLLGDAVRPIPKRAKTILRTAHNNAGKAEMLLDEALQADRLEAGDLPCNPEPVEIAGLVSRAALVNTGFAATYDVRFEIRDDVGEARVNADPARLEEVMTNLLSSAAKFSPLGEMVTISITRNGGCIRVAVSDKGLGSNVSHGDADGKHGGSRADEDSGLGLDISRAALKQHGASLHIDSRPGSGTTFWFELSEIS